MHTIKAESKQMDAEGQRIGVDRYVNGTARYIADVPATGCLEAAFVRSPIARGKIVSVNLVGALVPHGPAVASITGDDAARSSGPFPHDWKIASHASYDYWCLARDQVLYVGDPIAAVAAETPHEAQLAADLAAVELQVLPPVVSVVDAALPTALLRPELGTNVLYEAAGHGAGSTGEAYPVASEVEPLETHVERVRSLGPHFSRQQFRTARITAVPMEPRGCLAEFRNGRLRIYSSTQIPVMMRRNLVEILGLPEANVEVIAPDIGGGFGIKITVAREEVAVCLLAMMTGRPVRWLEDTVEHLQNAPVGRDQLNDASIAYDDRGKVLALHVDSLNDVGAYSVAPLSSAVEAAALPVRLPAVFDVGDYSYRSRAVATNKPWLGTYRGVAAPVGVFVLERLLQNISIDLGMDFADVQEVNLLPEGQVGRNPAGVAFDPGYYRQALGMLKEKLEYCALREEQSRRWASGNRELLGIGISGLVEPSAVSMDGLGLRIVTDWEDAFVRLNPDCTVEVRISATSSGQAHETTFAEIAGRALGVPARHVRVQSNGTSDALYGSGSWGSRVTVVAGGAVAAATAQIVEKLRAIAASMLGVDADTVMLGDGAAVAKDGRVLTLAELCEVAYFRMSDLPPHIPPGLAALGTYRPAKPFTSPYGFHGCVLAVDTLTGRLRIEKYVVVSDAGPIVTPELLDEQVRGGVAQGLGEALLEEILHRDDGVPLTNSLFDYRLPRAWDVPDVEVHHIETAATGNVLGVRGAGEDGAIGAPAAIATALTDAFRPIGFRVNALPVSFAAIVEAGERWRSRSPGAGDGLAGFTAGVAT